MGVCYALQYLDKAALSQSVLLGLEDVEHGGISLPGSQFSWATSIFYFGYLFWSFPSSYLIVKLPMGKYISIAVAIWGGILMCLAACKTFTHLMVVRFFLGVAEAAVAPGFSLITGMFYTRKEQPIRQAAWFLGNCLAIIVGGLIAYGVGMIEHGALPNWKILFVIEGSITFAYGIFMFFVLPDSVQTTWFLNEEQKKIALARSLKNKTGDTGDDHQFKWEQVWDSLTDPQVILLSLANIVVCMTAGALTAFQPQIIKGLGFSNLRSILLQLSNGGAEIVFMIITSAIAAYVANMRATQMVGLVLSVIPAVNTPLSVSLITANIAGRTKRSICSALFFITYGIGNIIGPQFYMDKEKPEFPTGIRSTISAFAFSLFFIILLFLYYIFENKRRNSKYGRPEDLPEEADVNEMITEHTDRTITGFSHNSGSTSFCWEIVDRHDFGQG
ncbi:hypothetical protein KEM56_001668 [Ascosphaera pollenicola]|nr:hypothetical protein KEM56_001668 [Ascosphaera pollenicola]